MTKEKLYRKIWFPYTAVVKVPSLVKHAKCKFGINWNFWNILLIYVIKDVVRNMDYFFNPHLQQSLLVRRVTKNCLDRQGLKETICFAPFLFFWQITLFDDCTVSSLTYWPRKWWLIEAGRQSRKHMEQMC